MDGGTERAGARAWLGLAVLVLPTLMLGLDLTVLYMALPHLGAELGATSTQLLWMTDVYGFMVAGLLITMGTVGDRIGRRRLLLIGATGFAAASVVAAYSTSAEMLIGARVLLGIAGATLMPSTLSLLRTLFAQPRQRSLAIGVWLIAFSVGGVTGPAIGGVLLEHFWWGSVFLLAVPVMVLLLLTGPVLLPEARDPDPGRVDLVSVVLSLAAVLSVVYGLKETARDGAGALPLALIAAGVLIAVVFVRRQLRLPDPLLDLALFARRRFTAATVALMLTMPVMYSFGFYFTQHLQLVEGLSPSEAGLWFLPLGAATVVASLAAPVLAGRFRPATVIVVGLVVAVAGFGLISRLEPGSGLTLLIVGGVLVSLGVNALGTLGTDIVVSSAPPERVGSASAVSETSNEFGAAMGIAVGGSVGAAIYSGRIADELPSGVTGAAADTVRDSFAGAFAVAPDLPAPVAEALLAAAREAFLAGLTTVTTLSAVAVAGIGVLVATTLRHVPPIGQETPEPEDRAASTA
ncbi:MFS transporter [Jiangella alba]|uniref:MFS transporter, DHA2 family, multidrug resistance protein n=1 Tax=Jiangella alba TaxID=561176 RepID=A0A1H5PRE8_9ACTN|nr:MFS transporter [Jiangella alba]SEF16326.1 MFS transporter, DHA2 family, multidrug resistance protein [Jiangella alba]